MAATPTFAQLPPEESGNEAVHEATAASMNGNNSVATLSSPWQFDDLEETCTSCKGEFNPFNRRHHCRLCGRIFCHDCSNQRCVWLSCMVVLLRWRGQCTIDRQCTIEQQRHTIVVSRPAENSESHSCLDIDPTINPFYFTLLTPSTHFTPQKPDPSQQHCIGSQEGQEDDVPVGSGQCREFFTGRRSRPYVDLSQGFR